MQLKVSNIMVRKINRNRVFRFINSVGRTSMPSIGTALGMSGPTVLQMIRELMELKVIEEVGEFGSTGGRKAKAVSISRDFCYAVGIDITRNHISILLLNIVKEIDKCVRIRKPFVLEENYFIELSEILCKFIKDCKVPEEKIIGVGLTVPGAIDYQNSKVSCSHILDIENVDCEIFLRHIPYPGVLLNSSKACVLAEYFKGSRKESMVYLSLSNSVEGALILNLEGESSSYLQESSFNQIYIGNKGKSAEFGHMIIHSHGQRCYCGKKGCLNVYCSVLRLTNLTHGNLEEFFEGLERNDCKFEKVWNHYLADLAIAVDTLRMCFGCTVVLGGYLGRYMGPYLEGFRKMLSENNSFGDTCEYVKVCKYHVEASALGGALYQMEKYIDTI